MHAARYPPDAVTWSRFYHCHFAGGAYALASAATILVLDRAPHGAEHTKHLLVGSILWVDWAVVGKLALSYAVLGGVLWRFHSRIMTVFTGTGAARAAGLSPVGWDLLFYGICAMVVTSSVQVAGVLISYVFDLPTGAAVVCSFGAALAVAVLVSRASGQSRVMSGRARGRSGDLPAFTAVFGALLSPQDDGSLAYWREGAVAFDQTGIIRHCGPASAIDHPGAGRGGPGAWTRLASPDEPWVIVPGFVDIHVHLPQLELRGVRPASLLDWLGDQVFRAEMAFADPSHAAAGIAAFDRTLLACGTTAAGIFATVHEEVARLALADLRVRGVVGKVLMDREVPSAICEPAAAGIAATERLLATSAEGAIDRRAAVTPRFAVSCSSELLSAAGELARRRAAPVMTHLAESVEEVALVRSLFPGHRSYTGVYAAHGLLTPRTIVAHAIHLDDEDWRALATSGAAVAHCPTANLALGSGRMPLECLRGHGIRYALGTDVGAGPSLSLWHVIDAFLRVHRGRVEVTGSEALYRATVAGSELLGFRGGLAPGRAADLAIFPWPPGVPAGADGETIARGLAAITADEPEPRARLTLSRGQVMHGGDWLEGERD